MRVIFRGRRIIWSGWKVSAVAPTQGKWRFKSKQDQSWDSFFVAGAVFGGVGGWRLLFRALYMTFHMWDGSIMRFILRGKCSTWWVGRVTLLALRIVDDASYVRRINHEIHFAWQAQYLVKLEADSCCTAHCKWRFHMCDGSIMRFILRGRRSILWRVEAVFCCVAHGKWRFICEQDQSWDSCFWQAQYLVKLEDDTCCSPHCKWRFNHELLLCRTE